MKLKRSLYGPQDPRGPSHGRDVKDFVKRTLHRVEADFFPKPPGGFDDVYNEKTVNAVKAFQHLNDIEATGNFGQATLDAMWEIADAYSRWVYRVWSAPDPMPRLGPVYPGGKSVLDHDLTHATSGIDLYPAFDDAFRAGTPIVAPERIEVTQDSSSRPGDAFYAAGASKIDYWFGHLVKAPRVGAVFLKGQQVGVVLDHSIGGGPHVHVGINVERLLGEGVELEHRTDYRHGAPTIREQLAEELA